MAGHVIISPLLRPRPDFLGVGVGCGHLHIFFELITLSGMSHIISIHNISIEKPPDLTDDYIEDITLEEAQQSSQDNHNDHETQETVQSAIHIEHQKYQVFELDSDGKPTKLKEYKLTDKTLLLFRTLTSLNISFRTEIYKPKECRLSVDQGVLYCKNLFLKDRKSSFFLVICHEDQNADLKKLRRDLKASRNFNFGTAEDMDSLLGVEPGGVTPLALMNQKASDVSMVICKSLLQESATLMFHPMDSNLAVEITMTDLLRFLKHFNHPVKFVKSS